MLPLQCDASYRSRNSWLLERLAKQSYRSRLLQPKASFKSLHCYALLKSLVDTSCRQDMEYTLTGRTLSYASAHCSPPLTLCSPEATDTRRRAQPQQSADRCSTVSGVPLHKHILFVSFRVQTSPDSLRVFLYTVHSQRCNFVPRFIRLRRQGCEGTVQRR